MSELNFSSATLLTDLKAYRDKIIQTNPRPYQEGYLDGLNMAIFMVEAAINLEQCKTLRITFDDINRGVEVVQS